MKTVGIITNTGQSSGVGSRAHQMLMHMKNAHDVQISPIMLNGKSNSIEVNSKLIRTISRWPGTLSSKSISWIRLAKHIPKFDMYDLSNQSLSFIAKNRHPSIVTVHDIIELTDPQDSRATLLNKYLLSGIVHAEKIVAVSHYTKNSIHDYFGIAESAITVIPNGVSEGYTHIPSFTSTVAYEQLKQDYKIGNRTPVILSVGSEHPRKNMETTLRAISHIKQQYPNVLLLKVGEPGILSGRAKTLELIQTLKLQSNVKFLGTIPQERINELYNSADALLFPSYHEGFGLPPLEAMAAGCVVICSNATSLPEVVGDGAITHNPEDDRAFAESIMRTLTDQKLKADLIQKGLDRAKKFRWQTSADAMLELYRSI